MDSAGRPINTSVRTGDASGKIDNIFSQEKIDAEFALGTNLSRLNLLTTIIAGAATALGGDAAAATLAARVEAEDNYAAVIVPGRTAL